MPQNRSVRGRYSQKLGHLSIGQRFWADGKLYEMVGYKGYQVFATELKITKFHLNDVVNPHYEKDKY